MEEVFVILIILEIPFMIKFPFWVDIKLILFPFNISIYVIIEKYQK